MGKGVIYTVWFQGSQEIPRLKEKATLREVWIFLLKQFVLTGEETEAGQQEFLYSGLFVCVGMVFNIS